MAKVTTPIYDFVNKYAKKKKARFHMPGHKGKNVIGIEKWDITEINGADSLFEAEGIIAQSEKNLSDIFGTKASFYSTEGSSLCIRSMLYAALKTGSAKGKNKIIAARNVHKAFIYACAVLDFETVWINSADDSLYTCKIDENVLEKALLENPDTAAVYVTRPDYLGNMQNIEALSQVCKKHDTPLLVDNAHGSYLKFVTPSMHPVDLGADMCCDSAHKTLPVLTPGAYLHISKNCKYDFDKDIKNAMALFASTSPSYIIMASLDRANMTLCDGFDKRVEKCVNAVKRAKTALKNAQYEVLGDEPLKITLRTKSKGYYGYEIASKLEQNGIVVEAYDRDNVVLMFSPYNTNKEIQKLCKILVKLETKQEILEKQPTVTLTEQKMTVREALMSVSEKVRAEQSIGRVLAAPSVSCPPAIPVAICGSVITQSIADCFKYYGIEQIDVVK